MTDFGSEKTPESPGRYLSSHIDCFEINHRITEIWHLQHMALTSIHYGGLDSLSGWLIRKHSTNDR